MIFAWRYLLRASAKSIGRWTEYSIHACSIHNNRLELSCLPLHYIPSLPLWSLETISSTRSCSEQIFLRLTSSRTAATGMDCVASLLYCSIPALSIVLCQPLTPKFSVTFWTFPIMLHLSYI